MRPSHGNGTGHLARRAVRLDLGDVAQREAVERFVCERTGADSVRIASFKALSGGAIQENVALEVEIEGGDCAGRHAWVLRTDAPSSVAASLTRAQEFAVLEVAHAAGVLAPQPLWCHAASDRLPIDFFLMERIEGVAAGHRLVRDAALVPDGEALARELGANLALLHGVAPPVQRLAFLPVPERPALEFVAQSRRYLDSLPEPHPVLEWGLAWCERHAPAAGRVTLIHRDYRTGNYLVHAGRLAAVLDWEFAAFGDPLEDIGWLFAKCWRFGGAGRCGGVGGAAAFSAGYEAVSGTPIDPDAIEYWEVVAHLRWALIALQQSERHLSGEQRSIELALTGHIPAELKHEILVLTGGEPA